MRTNVRVPKPLWDAVIGLLKQCEAYHEDCGHDSPGGAECDPVCDAAKVVRRELDAALAGLGLRL